MKSSQVDVKGNRTSKKWTHREQAGRIVWSIAWPFFRYSPRPFWGWRRLLLRIFGAEVGLDVRVYPSTRIVMPWNVSLGDGSSLGDCTIIYALGKIKLGARSTVSQNGHLCAGSHDWRDPTLPLLKPPITIGTDVWIAADAFIGPGVLVGDGAVIGARAVVMKDCPPRAILVGNPARQIGTRDWQKANDATTPLVSSERFGT